MNSTTFYVAPLSQDTVKALMAFDDQASFDDRPCYDQSGHPEGTANMCAVTEKCLDYLENSREALGLQYSVYVQKGSGRINRCDYQNYKRAKLGLNRITVAPTADPFKMARLARRKRPGASLAQLRARR